MNNKRNKWSLAIGCTGRDMCYTLVSLFFLTYTQFTNLLNTQQFIVLSGVIVACRVWDAVNDPMMGTIISNTKSKFGKYRPWVLIGAITNAIFLICMFTIRVEVNPDTIDTLGWWNVAILGISYLLWGMTYTMNDVSYWSLLPVLAEEKTERDNLTTMVAVFASIGAFTAGGLVPVLTPTNMIVAYRVIAIVFAIVFLLCQFLVFFLVHDNKEDKFKLENVEVDNNKSLTLKDMLKILLRNKQLLVMSVVVLFNSLASAILNAFGQNFFYFKYEYGGSQMFIFTVMYAIGTIGSQAIYPMLASKFKRMNILSVCTLAIVLGYVGFFISANFIPNLDIAFILLCLFGCFVFFGQGVFYMVMLVMLTNTIEYDEWVNNQRNDAITFSVRPFMVKLAGAIQYLVVSIALVVCGLYDITSEIGLVESEIAQGITDKIQGNEIITELLNSAQSWQIMGLSIAMSVIPIVLYVITYWIIKKKYIITEELYEKMINEIALRK